MSFFGCWSAPVSVPPVFDTTPCLEHLMEYEDCVIDVGSHKKQFLMPAWPTLYPALHTGRKNMTISNQPTDFQFREGFEKDRLADT